MANMPLSRVVDRFGVDKCKNGSQAAKIRAVRPVGHCRLSVEFSFLVEHSHEVHVALLRLSPVLAGADSLLQKSASRSSRSLGAQIQRLARLEQKIMV